MKQKRTRWGVVLLAVAVVMSLLTISAAAIDEPDLWDGRSVDTEWYTGNGDTFTLDSAADLAGLAKLVNAGNTFYGKTIKLGADIDLGGKEWTPIGTAGNPFQGTFDGNEHTISHLTINQPSSTHQGLFGYIKGASYNNYVVVDLTLSEVNVTGSNYTGGLSGQSFTCAVKNVTVSGNVTGGRYVGGLVGHVYSRFEDCTFVGSVTGAFGVQDQIGGIAGSGDGRFTNCNAIQGDDCDYLVYGYAWNGGIIGGGQESASATGCYVKGDIRCTGDWWGCYGAGIAGEAGMCASCVFQNNYFDGLVYCGDEVVNAPIIGLVNTDDPSVVSQMTVSGNSWNTEKYPAGLTVAVAAMGDKPFDEVVANASRKEPRNTNLVGSVSDLQYMEAGELKIVGNEITEEKLQEFANDSDGTYKVTIDSKTGKISVVKIVAKVNDKTFSSLSEAIESAKDGGTVELMANVTVGVWNQAWDAKDLTINGNGFTWTVGKVESNVNGNYLLYGAENLKVNDLTVIFQTNGNGFDMVSGSMTNVKMYGAGKGYGVFVGGSSAENKTVTIDNCEFYDFAYAIGSEPVGDTSATNLEKLVIRDCVFEDCDYATILYTEKTEFTGNTVLWREAQHSARAAGCHRQYLR